ncbi:MAG: nickel pincer cofactor biosynthesis protein LarC [Clostridiales bacterium]|nr:nickel pincer cofactor biosynthesis protein LarC [Clostridiales bacterium]MCF8022482.1 nickel pincer cofactor biosynthesis protein LarC [Clostridiales bacterium]
MKILFIDCFSGISGDMFLSALLDAGLDENKLLNNLYLLNLPGYSVSINKTTSYGISGKKIAFHTNKDHPHRNLDDIQNIIKQSRLSNDIKDLSLNIFYNLARAEAKVHNTDINKIHFHEVGAVDSILDIVGAAIAVNTIKPDKIYCNTVSLGSGYITCDHGILPVPAPATAELIKGFPVSFSGNGELTTPTGAAILKTLINKSIQSIELEIQHIGYGIGSKDTGNPNTLRTIIGKKNYSNTKNTEEIYILECNIDDMNPEFFPYLQEKLLNAGALDVYFQNILMKKGRPGIQIKLLCFYNNKESLQQILFNESTTLGIRCRKETRKILSRKLINIPTIYGNIRLKTGYMPENNNAVQTTPEYEDCKAAAQKYNLPISKIYREVLEKSKDYI